jgi:hypothetical protein
MGGMLVAGDADLEVCDSCCYGDTSPAEYEYYWDYCVDYGSTTYTTYGTWWTIKSVIKFWLWRVEMAIQYPEIAVLVIPSGGNAVPTDVF